MANDVQSKRVLNRLIAQEQTGDSLRERRTAIGKQIGTARKEFTSTLTAAETSGTGNEVEVLKSLTSQQHDIDELVGERTELSKQIRESDKTFDQIMGEAAETAGGQIDAFKGQTFHERGRGKTKKNARKVARAGKRADMTRSVSRRAKSKAARNR